MMALRDRRHWRRAIRWALPGAAALVIACLAGGEYNWRVGLLISVATLIAFAASLMTGVESDVDFALAYWE